MAVIKISDFGGISPSVDARNLRADGAQTAENLELRYGDFRPLRGVGASVATVGAGTVSLHRTPSGVWLSSTTDTDYVNGQINSAESERVYLTGHAAYPQVWEDGSYRRLGVPAPTAAPTPTVVAGEEFSTDERAQAVTATQAAIVAIAAANRTETNLGLWSPASAPFGATWISELDGVGDLLPRQWAYCTPITLGPPTAIAPSDAYLLDVRLGGRHVELLSVDYWAVPMMWLARGYEFDVSAMATAIEALLQPPDNVDPLFSSTEATAIATLISDAFSETDDPVASYIEAVTAAEARVVEIAYVTDVDPQRTYAMMQAIATLNSAVARLTDHYTALNASLATIVSNALSGYQSNIPVAVERDLETRAYIYTYVTDRGEESAPSPTTDLVTLDQNDTVDVVIGTPGVSAPYGTLTYWRLYRSSTTNVGAAYSLVAEIAIGTLTYSDSKLQEELQESCPSLTWTEPRDDMVALLGMPNGIMAGLADEGRILCFSEPYEPYAWPREYEVALEFPGVGLGGFGQTAVVLTQGKPSYVSGADSANMSEQKLESPQACVSKRSIVSTEGGVIYASPDGICVASGSGVELLTLGAWSKEDWQALGLDTSFAEFSEGVYYLVTEN